jgi:hypothetical protein
MAGQWVVQKAGQWGGQLAALMDGQRAALSVVLWAVPWAAATVVLSACRRAVAKAAPKADWSVVQWVV